MHIENRHMHIENRHSHRLPEGRRAIEGKEDRDKYQIKIYSSFTS